ncbi:MAG: hypothetical protein CM15mP23_08510 [Cryomorphaceae bacterium]|nr:MAG: hypothetical protein CM15mP23_08510 [Cryomorphaceae bacterium]
MNVGEELDPKTLDEDIFSYLSTLNLRSRS